MFQIRILDLASLDFPDLTLDFLGLTTFSCSYFC